MSGVGEFDRALSWEWFDLWSEMRFTWELMLRCGEVSGPNWGREWQEYCVECMATSGLLERRTYNETHADAVLCLSIALRGSAAHHFVRLSDDVCVVAIPPAVLGGPSDHLVLRAGLSDRAADRVRRSVAFDKRIGDA